MKTPGRNEAIQELNFLRELSEITTLRGIGNWVQTVRNAGLGANERLYQAMITKECLIRRVSTTKECCKEPCFEVEHLRARNAALKAGFNGGELAEIITELARQISELKADIERLMNTCTNETNRGDHFKEQRDELRNVLKGMVSIETSVTQEQERELRAEWLSKARTTLAKYP